MTALNPQNRSNASPRITMINFRDNQPRGNSRFDGSTCGQWWPACLCAEDAAKFLGWPPYFLTLLARAGHIKPLGKPAQNSRKWYATVELARLGSDPEWLDKAIRIIERRAETANPKTGPKRSRRGEQVVLPTPALN